MSTLNITLLCRRSKSFLINYRHLLPDMALLLNPSGLNNSHFSQIFMAPRIVRAIEVQL